MAKQICYSGHARPAILEEIGIHSNGVRLEDLGGAGSVTLDKRSTAILDGAGKPQEPSGRINPLLAQIEETASGYGREKLRERLARLAGGVARIQLGAATETGMKEKKAREEDASPSSRATVEEGIVPRAGPALLRASLALEKLTFDGAGQFGVNAVRRAGGEPARQIVLNRGTAHAVADRKILETGDPGFGFNATTEQYADLVKAGVTDPAKVTRTELQNAASIASQMLTTEAMICGDAEAPGA